MEHLSTVQTVRASSGASKSKKPVVGILIGLIALALLAGYIISGYGAVTTGGSAPASPLVTPRSDSPLPVGGVRQGSQITRDDPLWGPAGSSVTVVEFSDFECPYCREAFPIVSEVIQKYGNRVLFQYRDFPISDIHPDAQKAAEAAQCAHDQGKFWAYHNLLFQNQEDLSREALTRYALGIGLDIAAFNRCLDGGANTQEVLADFQDGVAAGVSGTPTFYINGVKYEGVLTEEEFVEILEGLFR